MARNGRNNVSFRQVAAGAFVFIGLFALFFGFGSGSQTLIVTGAAVVVLAFSLRLFNSLRRTPRQWVIGTALVLEVSEPPTEVRYGRCVLQLAIDAPGIPEDPVRVTDARAPVAQWPFVGADLPVEVAADDPRVVRILWRNIPAARSGAGGIRRAAEMSAGSAGQKSRDSAPRTPDLPYDDLPEDMYDDLPEDLADDLARREPAEPAAGRRALVAPQVERPTLLDFDLDHPPPPAPRGPERGRRPVVMPLPPELGPLPDEQPASAGTGEEAAPVTGTGPAAVPRLRPGPQPRPRPSPRPRRQPEPEPALVGAVVGGRGGDQPTMFPSAHPGPAGAINNVGITVLVSDLDRSTAFYRDRLGFYEDPDADAGAGSMVLASGETRLVLRASPGVGRVQQRSVFLNLEVGDIDGVYADLRAAGVRFTKPPRVVSRGSRRELWAATFQDPDGHGIALTQWRPAVELAVELDEPVAELEGPFRGPGG